MQRFARAVKRGARTVPNVGPAALPHSWAKVSARPPEFSLALPAGRMQLNYARPDSSLIFRVSDTIAFARSSDGRRGLAKKAKEGKGKKGKATENAEDAGEAVDTSAIIKDMAADCANALSNLDTELGLLRTGRADPRVLDKVRVEAYGASVSLEKVAQATPSDARTLTVNVFDTDLVAAVDKAIRGAGLDLNPQIAGSTLRVPIPKVTQEGRKKLTKQASSIAENAKVVVRRIRHHYMDKGKKLDLPKDDAKKYEKDVQQVHDVAVKDVDAKVKSKQAELLDD